MSPHNSQTHHRVQRGPFSLQRFVDLAERGLDETPCGQLLRTYVASFRRGRRARSTAWLRAGRRGWTRHAYAPAAVDGRFVATVFGVDDCFSRTSVAVSVGCKRLKLWVRLGRPVALRVTSALLAVIGTGAGTGLRLQIKILSSRDE